VPTSTSSQRKLMGSPSVSLNVRRLGPYVLSALVLAACTTQVTSGGTTSTTQHQTLATSQATSPTSTTQHPTPSTAHAITGKFSVWSLAFPDPEHGMALLGGFLHGSGPLVTWLDLTKDGGRTWHAEPWTASAAAAGPNSLDAVMGSFAYAWGPDDLYATTNDGLTWRLVDTRITDLASVGGNTWALTSSCATPGSCRTKVLASGSPGAAFSPVASQPPIGGATVVRFIHPGLATGYLLATSSGTGRQQLWKTSDGGALWSRLALPCRQSNASINDLAGDSANSLWLVCSWGPMLSSSGLRSTGFVRSNDGGVTWHVVSSRAFHLFGATIDPLTSSTAWAWAGTQSAGNNPGAVFRTTDGGSAWAAVEALGTGSPQLHQLLASAFAATTASDAWVAGLNAAPGASPLEVLHTANGGRSWTSSPLPAPA